MTISGILRTSTLLLLTAAMQAQAASPEVRVYKTRTCGCCGKWVTHLKANGFNPVVTDVESTAEYRQKAGIPAQLASCHTATVEGYSLEGHVPAADIQKLLNTKPKAKGLAVPGMPAGSPGMEGSRQDAYSVVLIDNSGHTSVFTSYPSR